MLDTIKEPIDSSPLNLDTEKRTKPIMYVHRHNPYRILSFTQREVDILESLSVGHRPNAIAEELCLSHHTIKTHIRNMLKKSGCTNSVMMIANALRAGVIS